MRQSAIRLALLTILPTLAGCAGLSSQPRMVAGQCADMFGAEACTWALVDGQEVVEVGVTIPVAAIEHAPVDAEMAWPPVEVADLMLPEEAVAARGLHHLKIYWEAHGHPPGPYLYPHFDFHFYNISPAQTNAIDCASLTKPSQLPSDYVLPDIEIPPIGMLIGLCVPKMGMHSLPESEYTGTEPFTGTMVVGYYDSSTIFVEPMITGELLMRRQSFSLVMPVVEEPAGVSYPTWVRADYDAVTDAYRLVLGGF